MNRAKGMLSDLTPNEQEELENIIEQQDQLAKKNDKATEALENFELSSEMVRAGITRDTIHHVIKDYF